MAKHSRNHLYFWLNAMSTIAYVQTLSQLPERPPMSRPPSVTKRISKNISLPEYLVARMELELYSEVDGRIPVGAQSQLIEALLRQHYTRQDNAQATFVKECQ